MLTDTHAHITDEAFGGAQSIIDTMTDDGLGCIVTIGCDVPSSIASVEAAHLDPRVYAAVGVHPYYPETVTDEVIETLRALTGDEKVVAVGEFGLDYHHDEFDREAQIKAMVMQYELAREVGLPMVFHVREATGDFVEFLRKRDFPQSGVMHCFSGSVETAEICLKKGLYLAFGGKLTYNNSKNLIAAAAAAPLDRLLLETDAPYLTPSKFLGQTNYPKHVALVRDRLAEIKGISPDEIERITNENARRLFFRIKN